MITDFSVTITISCRFNSSASRTYQSTADRPGWAPPSSPPWLDVPEASWPWLGWFGFGSGWVCEICVDVPEEKLYTSRRILEWHSLKQQQKEGGGGLIYCRWCDPLSAQYNEAYTALNHAPSALTRRDISHICSGSVRCKRSFRTYTPKLCICFSLFSFPSCNLGKCRLITADIQFRTFKWTRKNSLEEVSISERVSLSEEVSISQSWT